MIVALIVGTVLSIAVLAYVLAPVVVGVGSRRGPVLITRRPQPEDMAIAALREVEFDRATGKLSDDDYGVLRERYATAALAGMRKAEASPVPPVDDPAEAAVRAYRARHASCAHCGIRPEADAIYCSNCGSFLPGKCAGCGIAITAAGVRYCISCGERVAA